MYLNRIEVRNFRLQGQDIIWDLNPDVNILVGYNGCGKTSLLKMVYEVYNYRQVRRASLKTVQKQEIDKIKGKATKNTTTPAGKSYFRLAIKFLFMDKYFKNEE